MWLKLGAKEVAGAEEVGLDGAFGEAEAGGGGGDVHLLKVIQEEDFAVFGWQGVDGFVEGGVFLMVF